MVQPSFIGKEACGFHDTSFLSLMKRDAGLPDHHGDWLTGGEPRGDLLVGGKPGDSGMIKPGRERCEVTDEDGFLSHSMMIKAKDTIMKERIWINVSREKSEQKKRSGACI